MKLQRTLTDNLARSTVLMLGAAWFSGSAFADQYHYNNVIIGPRAVGLGGAFAGVSDDASGVYYNPAGLAFALSNDIQGSANAFYGKTAEYKNTLGEDSFIEESSGSLSPFFGGLQKLDRYMEGLVFAFGVYTIDSDLKDQDTLIENKVVNSTTIERYHRTSNARASTYYAGAALAYRPTPALAVGFGLNYFNADELVQEYQDAQQTVPITVSGESQTGYRVLTSNVREHLSVHGIQPTLGFQTSLPGNIALGLTLKKGIIASQKLDVSSETRLGTLTADQYSVLKSKQNTSAVVAESIDDTESSKPVGEWPAEARFGMAWFASPTFLMAFDVSHTTAVTSAEKLKSNNNKAKYNKEAVTNLHLGVEYYLTASLPLRLGFFTNNDARPEVQKGDYQAGTANTCQTKEFADKYCAQADSIDYIGESIFIGWVQPNSQLAAGITLQQGKGKAQKLGDHQVQDVEASAYAFSFSATTTL
jgi:long-chain fatty acid transport protein